VSLLVDEFAAWLQAQGEGTVMQTIFKMQRPAAPVACVTVHVTGGYPPPHYTRREFPTLQVVARAASPKAALDKAYSMYNRTHGKVRVTMGGLHAFTMHATASPAYIGEEQAANVTAHLAAFNLVFDLRRPSSP